MLPKAIRFFFLLLSIGLFAQQADLEHADSLFDQKQFKKAESVLLKLYNVNPSQVIKERLADTYAYQRKWDEAISLYGELVHDFPKNAEYQFKYGGALARKAEISSRLKALMVIGKIKKSFTNAVELNPGHIEALWCLVDYHLAVPALLGGSTKKAFGYAERLKTISPVEGYFALGYVYHFDDQPIKANKNFQKTIQFFDELGTVQRNQLNFLVGQTCSDFEIKLDFGIAKMKDYIAGYSVKDGVPVSRAYYHLAKLYRLKNNRTQANIWIKKALASNNAYALAKEEQKIIEML
ncbi:MAG: tetratricopeptide repeat protein [Bacteroidota bacterium]